MDIENMEETNEIEAVSEQDTVSETNDTNHANSAEKADGSLGYDPAVWSKAPRKCPKTGRFLPGTGGSLRGGRPQGSRDKISRQLIEICSDLVADKGSEILEHLAKTDPAAAMAICLKVVPNSEWVQAHTEERQGDSTAGQEVTIRLVSAPSQRLPDSRTEAQIQARQRGLTPPVERLPEPTQDDLRDVIEAEVDAPTEPIESSQERADREAAQAERERVRRQNETLRQYGGRTGAPSRAERADNGIEYPDDGVI